jgi:hypothetical protein
MSRRIVACAEIVGRGGRRVFDVFSCVLVIFDFSLNYFQSFITPLISVLASPLSASFQRCQRVCCLCTFWSTQCLLWCRFWGIYCTSIWRTISVLWAVSWRLVKTSLSQNIPSQNISFTKNPLHKTSPHKTSLHKTFPHKTSPHKTSLHKTSLSQNIPFTKHPFPTDRVTKHPFPTLTSHKTSLFCKQHFFVAIFVLVF